LFLSYFKVKIFAKFITNPFFLPENFCFPFELHHLRLILKNKNGNYRTLRNKKFLKFSLEMRKNIHILKLVINYPEF
ncbi:TPA: hypothetical protein ACPJNN_000410, partial [Haemophilus influenzae]